MGKEHEEYRPYHLYVDDWCYFLTARCIDGKHFFLGEESKKIFVSVFQHAIKTFHIKVFAWVLLHNHYHMMVQIPDGRDMSKFVNNLHVNTARLLNKKDRCLGRSVWYQYWDYCIRNRPDFWRHFNYIMQNPLKHGLVKTLGEAYHHPYSSNPVWLERFGKDGLSESFEKYPVRDWTPSDVE